MPVRAPYIWLFPFTQSCSNLHSIHPAYELTEHSTILFHFRSNNGTLIIKVAQQIITHNNGRQESYLKVGFAIGYEVGETPEDTLETVMKKLMN